MALSKEGLADAIVSSLDYSVAPVMYLKAIKDYIESNVEVKAVYSGMTTSTPPVKDPITQPSKIDVTLNPSMPQGLKTKSFLKGIVTEANPDLFLTTLFLEMVPITFVGSGNVIFTMIAIYSLNSMIPDLEKLSKCDNYKDCWLIFAEHIVNTVKTFTPTTPAIPSVSTTPGTGITTIISVL